MRKSLAFILSVQRPSLKPSSFQGDEDGGRWAAAAEHGVALRPHFAFEHLQPHQLSATAIPVWAAAIGGSPEEKPA